RVTPIRVPPSPVAIRALPPVDATVPPLIVPPARFHEPVVSLSSSVPPVLFKVPARLTVPPLRLKVPNDVGVKTPPSVIVLPVSLSVPLLSHVKPPVVW